MRARARARLWDVRVRVCGCACVHRRACVRACVCAQMCACADVCARAGMRTRKRASGHACAQARERARLMYVGCIRRFVRRTQTGLLAQTQVLSTVEIIRSFHADHLLPAVEAELEIWTIGSTLGNAHARMQRTHAHPPRHTRTHTHGHEHAHARPRTRTRAH